MNPKIQSVTAHLKDAAGILKSLGQISNEDRKVIEEAFAPIRDAFPSKLSEEQQILSRFIFAPMEYSYHLGKSRIRNEMQVFSKNFSLTNGFTFKKVYDLVYAQNEAKNSRVFMGIRSTRTMWVLKEK